MPRAAPVRAARPHPGRGAPAGGCTGRVWGARRRPRAVAERLDPGWWRIAADEH
jgi:hypothetical protein